MSTSKSSSSTKSSTEEELTDVAEGESSDTGGNSQTIIEPTREDSKGASKAGRRLNASAGVLKGARAANYNIGDPVYVFHNNLAWPGIVEHPSYVKEDVVTNEFAVFLYGIHERKVAKLKDVFLYHENKKNFGGVSPTHILNVALVESRLNPEANQRRLPLFKKKRVQYLMKSRSHTLLDRYLAGGEDPNGQSLEIEDKFGDILTFKSKPTAEGSFYDSSFVSYDSALGAFAIVSSFLFMVYMTWWIIIMPFLEPEYHELISHFFPEPSTSLGYPIAGGTVVAFSIITFYATITYAPRVHAQEFVTVTATHDYRLSAERLGRLKEFLAMIRKRQPALLILLVSALIFWTPVRVFVIMVIVFGCGYLIVDLFIYL